MACCVPGIVPLALARVHQLVADHHQQNATWSRATASFASFQALAGYAYSALFSASHGQYALLFSVAAGAIGLALALDLLLVFKEIVHPSTETDATTID